MDEESNEKESAFSPTDSFITYLFQKQKNKLENSLVRLVYEHLCSYLESITPSIVGTKELVHRGHEIDTEIEDQYSAIYLLFELAKYPSVLSKWRPSSNTSMSLPLVRSSTVDKMWVIHSLSALFPNLLVSCAFHSMIKQTNSVVANNSETWKNEISQEVDRILEKSRNNMEIYLSYFYSNSKFIEIFNIKEECTILESISQRQVNSIVPWLSSTLQSIRSLKDISDVILALVIASTCPSVFKIALNTLFYKNDTRKEMKEDRKLDALIISLFLFVSDANSSEHPWKSLISPAWKKWIGRFILFILKIRFAFLLLVPTAFTTLPNDFQVLSVKKDFILSSSSMETTTIPLFHIILSLLESLNENKGELSVVHFIVEQVSCLFTRIEFLS